MRRQDLFAPSLCQPNRRSAHRVEWARAALACFGMGWAAISVMVAPRAAGAESPPNTATQQSTSQPAATQEMQRQAPAARRPAIPAGMRLLNAKEGRAILQNAAWADDEEGLAPDCSHLVHTLYARAGHLYRYASSTDLYRGVGHFFRVRYPQPGDLIVWPGHAGIVVDAREHSFFSTTSAGAQTENYRSAYWRARGRARFYRYLVTKSKDRTKASLTEVKQDDPRTKSPD